MMTASTSSGCHMTCVLAFLVDAPLKEVDHQGGEDLAPSRRGLAAQHNGRTGVGRHAAAGGQADGRGTAERKREGGGRGGSGQSEDALLGWLRA